VEILVTGTEACGIDEVERRLRAAGHQPRSMAPWGSTVPHVAVVVVARSHPLPHLTREERRIDALLHPDVPLVVAGSTVPNPYGARAAVLLRGFDGVAEACEEAAGPAAQGATTSAVVD
jgi:hypothetical protein